MSQNFKHISKIMKRSAQLTVYKDKNIIDFFYYES